MERCIVASNRLDRLTSGVMVCALTVEASRKLSTYFSTEGAVKKEYIARCRGQFPEYVHFCATCIPRPWSIDFVLLIQG